MARKKFNHNIFSVAYILWRRRCQTMVVSIADGTPASRFNGWNEDVVVLSACLLVRDMMPPISMTDVAYLTARMFFAGYLPANELAGYLCHAPPGHLSSH